MRSLLGLLWALGGAVGGFLVGALGATVFANVANMSNREGGAGYFIVAIGILGAIIGVIAGLLLYGRSAPGGQSVAYAGWGTFGLVAFVAAIAIGLWSFMQLREKPLEYGNAMANLQLEFRAKTTDIPTADPSNWLNIEVQTAKTRPEATVSWSRRRMEGDYTIIPAEQGPLYRSANRVIVVRVGEQQVEAFAPPMKRTPDRAADWSEWYRPRAVDAPYGVVPAAPLQSRLELRYRVKVYGDQ